MPSLDATFGVMDIGKNVRKKYFLIQYILSIFFYIQQSSSFSSKTMARASKNASTSSHSSNNAFTTHPTKTLVGIIDPLSPTKEVVAKILVIN